MSRLAKKYSVSAVCRTLGIARSSYYHRKKENQYTQEKRAIEKVVAKKPKYGYRRVAKQLKRENFDISFSKTNFLMKQMKLLQKKRKKKIFTTNSKHSFRRYPNKVSGITITDINQVYVADITYIKLQSGFVYLAVVMDVITRSIRGWELSKTIDHHLTVSALKQALSCAVPKIHHSDQGVQYASSEYTDILDDHEVDISMSDKGAAWQNGFCERLIRTIKEEEVELSEYSSFSQAYQDIQIFIEDVYMKKRIHSSLGYLTPYEFEQQCLSLNTVPPLFYK